MLYFEKIFKKILWVVILTIICGSICYYFFMVINDKFLNDLCEKYYCIEIIQYSDFLALLLSVIGLVFVVTSLESWKNQYKHERLLEFIPKLDPIFDLAENYFTLSGLDFTKGTQYDRRTLQVKKDYENFSEDLNKLYKEASQANILMLREYGEVLFNLKRYVDIVMYELDCYEIEIGKSYPVNDIEPVFYGIIIDNKKLLVEAKDLKNYIIDKSRI